MNKFSKPNDSPIPSSVAFFPSAESLSVNPYWPILASELEKSGCNYITGTPNAFSLGWLLSNKGKIDILHLHFVQQFYRSGNKLKLAFKVLRFGCYMLLARGLGYKTIFTLHNLEATEQLRPAWLDYIGYWIAANFSHGVIVYCDEARHLLAIKYGRRKKVSFVDHPNVISYYPNTISKKDARKKLNLEQATLVFMFIGNVRPNKGIEILIEAFSQLSNADFRLVIAGEIFPPTAYAQSLQQMAQQDARILFHYEHIPIDDIQIYLNAADIVVLPFSKILTSGTAHLAMSFGRAIIVPDMGCLPELIEGDAGWLFEADNPNSLADTMRLAASSDYKKMGQQAKAKLLDRTAKRFAEQTMSAYLS